MNAELYVLTQVNQEIANYTRAIARGNFTLLGATLREADMAQLDGRQQPAVLQLTPAALERHLERMTEMLRSGVNGKVREAIRASIARILVGVDGSLTIVAKPDGLHGVEGTHAHSGDTRDESPMIRQVMSSSSGRQSIVKTAAYG